MHYYYYFIMNVLVDTMHSKKMGPFQIWFRPLSYVVLNRMI